MNADTRRLDAALRALDLWPPGSARPLERLGHGPTRETWLVEQGRERYVVRLCRDDTEHIGLDCSVEAAVTRAAAEAGLAPPCVAAAPEPGMLITRYVDGRVWTPADLHDPAQRKRLAAVLARVHALRVVSRELALAATLRRYAGGIGTQEAQAWADDAAHRLLRVQPRASVVCHGDPVAANVVDNGDLFLIDWEYAGLCNPYFDLAVVLRCHDLDEDVAHEWLRAYDPGATAADQDDLSAWCAIFDRVHALWLALLDTRGLLSDRQALRLHALRARL